ncbi:MAG: hypothetical protein ABSB09_13810 [Acidimicrobiales bacterium]
MGPGIQRPRLLVALGRRHSQDVDPIDANEESRNVGEPALDTEELLERLRKEHLVLRWEPLPPEQARPTGTNDQVRSPDSLAFLNANWQLPDHFDPASAGGGIRGRIVALFGRLTFRVLGPYLKAERDFLSHVVRINNALEFRCDELTLRCQQLNQDMLNRQAAEARNLAKLAVMLHLEPPVERGPKGSPDHDAAPGQAIG